MAKTSKVSRGDTPAEATMVALEAVEPIRHDGVDIAPGEQFGAEQPVADALIAMGHAKAIE